MLLFFFPAHSETSLKTAVAVSVTATLKHVGVVVIVKVVASVLQKSYTLYAFRYMQMESLQIWTIGTICYVFWSPPTTQLSISIPSDEYGQIFKTSPSTVAPKNVE